MPIKDIPYHKPEKNHKSIIRIYKNQERIEVETRAYQSPEHIKKYKKVSAREMINTVTGKTKICNYKDIKDQKQVFKIMKSVSRLIPENFVGDDTELIIVIYFDGKMHDLKKAMKLYKSFFEKLERRIPKIIFIRILLYSDKDKPYFHLWLKTIDNVPLEIDQHELEVIWTEGEISTIRPTPDTVEKLSQYFMKKNCKMDLYPAFSQPVGTSKSDKLKKVQVIEVDYEEVEKLTSHYNKTFTSTKSIIETINNKEEELQRITYEEYKKIKIKLSRSQSKVRYRRKK